MKKEKTKETWLDRIDGGLIPWIGIAAAAIFTGIGLAIFL